MLLQMAGFLLLLWPSDVPLCLPPTFSLSIHPSPTPGCLHVSAPVSNASVNTGVRTSLRYPAFLSFREIPRRRVAGSNGSFIFNFFLRILHIAFQGNGGVFFFGLAIWPDLGGDHN